MIGRLAGLAFGALVLAWPGVEAAQAAVESQPAEKAKSSACPLPLPGKGWLPQEKWAWEERLCRGRSADMRHYIRATTGKNFACDPSDPESWPSAAVLRNRFLETVIRQTNHLIVLDNQGVEVYGHPDLLSTRGVKVVCARFPDKVRLEQAVADTPLTFIRSRFDKDLNIYHFRTSSSLIFHGSVLGGRLNAYAARIGGDFFIRKSRVMGPVTLYNANITGNLETDESVFFDRVLGDNMIIDGNLRLRNGADFRGEVRLGTVTVRQNASFNGSRFDAPVRANQLNVGHSLHMSKKARFHEVHLVSAKIGGSWDVVGSAFAGELSAFAIRVEGSVFLRDRAVFQDVNLANSQIGGSLDLSGSGFVGPLNLTNAHITNELLLSRTQAVRTDKGQTTQQAVPKWGDNAQLILRNARAFALQDSIESWSNLEDKLDLVGFRYEHLGGLRTAVTETMAARPVDWMLKWLGMQVAAGVVYQPQPYEHLAGVLRELGWEQKAREISFARYDYQLWHMATPTSTKLWLFIKWLIIGYGLKTWVSLLWLMGLVTVGSLVVWFTKEGRKEGFFGSFYFSLDLAIPFLELSPGIHIEQLEKLGRAAQFYFGFQRAMGLILVTFLAAGMSGLAGG